MGIFRRSLGEDKVDHYHHTWSVLFFIVLALVTWLLPLSPLLQSQAQPAKQVVISPGAATQMNPQIKVDCWCPVEFTGAMVAYTEATCGGAFKLALEGRSSAHQDIGAKLYNNPSFNELLPANRDGDEFKPKARKKPDSLPTQVEVNLPGGEEENQKKNSKDAWYFIHTKTPFVLFLLAVCLKIPHLVWKLLSSIVGGINVDQLLRSAKAGKRLDHENRRNLYRELTSSAAKKVRVCSWGSSCMYLLMKILMCVAVAAELVVVHESLLPQAKSQGEKLHQEYLNENMIKIVEATVKNATEERREYFLSAAEYYKENSDKLLICDFALRQLQNVQRFTVQCIFQVEEQKPTQDTIQFNSPTGSSATTPMEVVKMYETIFLIVQTVLVVLTAVNVVSFLVWLLKLLTPCRKTVVSDLDLPLDVCLLLQMAQENVGPEIVSALAHSGAWSNDGGKETEALNE